MCAATYIIEMVAYSIVIEILDSVLMAFADGCFGYTLSCALFVFTLFLSACSALCITSLRYTRAKLLIIQQFTLSDLFSNFFSLMSILNILAVGAAVLYGRIRRHPAKEVCWYYEGEASKPYSRVYILLTFASCTTKWINLTDKISTY